MTSGLALSPSAERAGISHDAAHRWALVVEKLIADRFPDGKRQSWQTSIQNYADGQFWFCRNLPRASCLRCGGTGEAGGLGDREFACPRCNLTGDVEVSLAEYERLAHDAPWRLDGRPR
jgi:hypothetical protein